MCNIKRIVNLSREMFAITLLSVESKCTSRPQPYNQAPPRLSQNNASLTLFGARVRISYNVRVHSLMTRQNIVYFVLRIRRTPNIFERYLMDVVMYVYHIWNLL